MRAPKPGPGGFIGDPYPLDFCIVDDKPLAAESVTLILKDWRDPFQECRHLRFCSEACLEKFKADSMRHLNRLDSELIKRFGPEYPLDHCLVMLDEKIESDAQAFVLGNRVYKTCCKKCVNNFQKNWLRYATAYEKAVTIKQKGKYPLDTCLVTGKKLPEKPYDLVIGARLVRLADEEAARAFYSDSGKYLAKLKEAANAKH